MIDIEKKRDVERQKYIDLYNHNPKYGDYDHSKGVRDYIINTLKPKSIVDVGCGGGQFAEFCKQNGIKSRGVDFASPYDIIAPAHSLPFADNKFEYVSAFDMLEHLVEEEVDSVIDEFKRVAEIGLILKISYVQSVSKGLNGELLHPTVKPEQWWLEKLGMFHLKVGPYIVCKN